MMSNVLMSKCIAMVDTRLLRITEKLHRLQPILIFVIGISGRCCKLVPQELSIKLAETPTDSVIWVLGEEELQILGV